MAYSLTVAGYTFENPPEEYRKRASVGNNPQPSVDKDATDYYQSDSQDIRFRVEGTLALDPALGGTDDLAELERLQQIAIEGGTVDVEFDPFFSGQCVIKDDPFRQAESESSYSFKFTVNSETTDASAYPARSPPDTGNTFELGSLNLGYDPDEVSQNYERQTETVKRLQGVSRSIDNAGLIPKVRLSGMIDGAGQAELWQKARDNVQAYLEAEFQKGWCLIDSLAVRNTPEAPDYLDGLFRYDLDVFLVSDAASGIGDVSSYVDQEVKFTGTYTSSGDSGDSSFSGQDFTVDGGSGSLDGDYLEWDQTTVTLSDNDTNYIYVDDADGDGYGDVGINQSAFPADALILYRVEVSGGSVQKVVDVRAILLNDREYEEGGDDGGETIDGDPYFTVFGGDYEISSGTTSTWNDTRLLLESNTRNWVWVEDDNLDGSAQVNTDPNSYPSSGEYIEMYRVDTDADSVVDVIDDHPSDISDGGSDTSDADISLNETISIIDGDPIFSHSSHYSDTLSVLDADSVFTVLASYADTLAVIDADPEFFGDSVLSTETLNLIDGGSADSGTAGVELQTTITLNGNTVQATVYEDTSGDGTADNQEQVTLSDGTNTVSLPSLTGGSSNTYWIQFDLSGDGSSTPTVDAATVDVTAQTGDPDQNPETAWGILGAEYDTSGNEYEGGGVISLYGG